MLTASTNKPSKWRRLALLTMNPGSEDTRKTVPSCAAPCWRTVRQGGVVSPGLSSGTEAELDGTASGMSARNVRHVTSSPPVAHGPGERANWFGHWAFSHCRELGPGPYATHSTVRIKFIKKVGTNGRSGDEME